MLEGNRELATQNGNDNGNGENIIAYIVVFEPKYTLLHLICLFSIPVSFKRTLKEK